MHETDSLHTHRVLSLVLWQDDTREEATLLISAEAQHSTLLALIWQAQKERNPSRDWSAPVMRMDTVIAAAKDAGTVSNDAVAQGATARYQVSFRVGMMRCVIEKESKSAKTLLDLSVNDLTGSVLAEASQVLTTAQVVKVQIAGSGKEGDTTPYDLLSQVADDTEALLATDSSPDKPAIGAKEGGDLPCIGLQITSKQGAETVCNIRMPKAFALRIDPHTVAGFSQLQSQVLDNWRNLRKVAAAAAKVSSDVDASSDSGDTKPLPHESEPSQSKRRSEYSSMMVLRGTGEVPESLMGDEDESHGGKLMTKTRMCTTLEAVGGLHLLLIDEDYHQLMLLKMQRVSLVKTDFTDCSAAVVGTLGKLEISDSSAPASVHPKFMTVSEEADALVHVDVKLYDKTSVVRETTRENLWQVSIFRPRITVLWRFVNDFLQYQRSFYSTSTQGPATPPQLSSITTAESTSLPTKSALSLRTAGNENAVPAGGRQQRGTVVKISLEHPELILPRSSTCTDAFLADLGRVDIERASRHSSDEWTVLFKETNLDTVHTLSGGQETKLSCVHDLDGTAQISFCEAGAARVVPEMSVNIDLRSLKGSISDAQYALLMSIFGENFTEKRAAGVGSGSPFKPMNRQTSHLAEDGTLGDKLGNIIDLARGLTAHLVPTSAYNLTIRDIELALNRSQPRDGDGQREKAGALDAEPWGVNPLLHARAGDLVVQYESFVGAIGRGGSQGLDSSCTAQLSRFELIDTRVGAVRKSEPLFAVRRPVEGALPSSLRDHLQFVPVGLDAGQQKPDTACADASTAVGNDSDGQELREDKRILLQYFKLSQGHTGINMMLRNVDTVFDVGLLMSAISWIGTSNGPAVDTDAFSYVVNRTGGFRVQTDLPDSSIHLVTAFDRADADGFHMKGSLSVTYASSASEDVLHVKVDDLALKMRETAATSGLKSNHNMDVIRPCGVMATWQWYRELSSFTPETLSELAALLEAEHNRRPKFFCAATDLRAMVTYEHMMLVMRVYYCLTSTLADSVQDPSSPSRASRNKPSGVENALSPKASPVSKSRDIAMSKKAKQQAELDLRIQGTGITLTLVDDYNGRYLK
jgi:RNA-binding protein YhbY